MDLKDFRNILESFMMKRCIEISYINADGEGSTRVVEPLKLMNYLGKWYLIAFCRTRKALRVFLISRFTSSRLTNSAFEYPVTRKELDKYIDGSFGMFKSETSSTAVIRVFEPAYYYVRNQIWHKNQKVKDSVIDGKKCLEITLPVGDRDKEILARVLYYFVRKPVFWDHAECAADFVTTFINRNFETVFDKKRSCRKPGRPCSDDGDSVPVVRKRDFFGMIVQ